MSANREQQATPKLLWDCGTAYDFFQSLMVLHHPSKFSVRGAWTAGMRARLSPEARDILERSQAMIDMPAHWIHALPEPKNVETALWSLGQIPPAERLEVLTVSPDAPPPKIAAMFQRVTKRGAWEGKDLDLLREHKRREYPSYWITPLIILLRIGPQRQLFLFGARPPQASLIPGETVPDTLLRALKALSDPTRLKILHYLGQEPLAAAELARRLRLRTPTVMHHLHGLRLGGLIQVTMAVDAGKEKNRYARRPNALSDVSDMLKGYLGNGR